MLSTTALIRLNTLSESVLYYRTLKKSEDRPSPKPCKSGVFAKKNRGDFQNMLKQTKTKNVRFSFLRKLRL